MPKTNLAPVKVEPITREELSSALPGNHSKSITTSILNTVNDLIVDEELCHNYRENLLNYGGVLKEGKYKLTDYLNAVKYVSHKMLGALNKDAYRKTFPDRYHEYMVKGYDDKRISAYVAMYHKTKLVQTIYEQAMIPHYIYNQSFYQEALEKQVHLMKYANSEKVQQEAADSVLKHLTPPQNTKLDISVKHDEGSLLTELRQATLELAETQKELIKSKGASVLDVAESKIIEHSEDD